MLRSSVKTPARQRAGSHQIKGKFCGKPSRIRAYLSSVVLWAKLPCRAAVFVSRQIR